MPKEHKVQPGDCISSIAFENGFFPDALWDHSSNANLKAKRKNPNVLSPGDIVHVPDKREKRESRDTDNEYVFRKKGVPAQFRLCLRENGKPLANLPYVLTIDGHPRPGKTDSKGWVIAAIPPNAHTGTLRVSTDAGERRYRLNLGQLDPVEDANGLQARLQNLGFGGGEGGKEAALRAFQVAHGLPPTGQPDEATLEKLRMEHDHR
jgi:N-acetylmuramoyl-L-alanine amidase